MAQQTNSNIQRVDHFHSFLLLYILINNILDIFNKPFEIKYSLLISKNSAEITLYSQCKSCIQQILLTHFAENIADFEMKFLRL